MRRFAATRPKRSAKWKVRPTRWSQRLIGMLQDVSAAARAAAARTLGSLKGKAVDAVPELVPLLQDREELVRQAAAEAVGRIGTLNGDATPKLVEGLGSADNVVRAETAEPGVDWRNGRGSDASVGAGAEGRQRPRSRQGRGGIGKIGEAAAEAVPSLVPPLRDKDNWVSAMAAEALGEMGESADDAIPALVRSLAHINPQVRANAAEALGKMGGSGGVDGAGLGESGARRRRCSSRRSRPRPWSCDAPCDEGSHSSGIDGGRRSRRAGRRRGGAGQARKTDDEIVNALLRALTDPADPVKVEATKALPRLVGPTESAIDGLCALLDADSAWVQVHAALGLGRLGPPAVKAGQALLRAAQTAELSVREQAMRALVMIQPPEIGPALAAGLKDASGEMRKVASAGLIKAAEIPPEVVPELTDALIDPEVQVRATRRTPWPGWMCCRRMRYRP